MAVRPTASGAVILVMAAATMVTGSRLGLRHVTAAGAGLAVLVAVGAAGLISHRPLARRTLRTSRIVEGAPVDARLEIHGLPRRRWAPAAVTVHDLAGNERVAVAVDTGSSPAGSAVADYHLPALARGRHRIGPLVVERRDPLGLTRLRWRIAEHEILWVHPRLVSLRPLDAGGLEDREESGRARRGGTSFHSLRDYEPGDDVRLIHWPSTARVGSAVVRDSAVVDGPTMVVVLDTTAPAYADGEAFEDAVRVAASAAVARWDQGLPVRLHTTDGLDLAVNTTGTGRRLLLDGLAAVTATPPGPRRWDVMPATAGPGHAVVLVTGDRQAVPDTVIRSVLRHADAVTLVHVGPEAADRAPVPTGARVVAGPTAIDVARAWNGGPRP
jgi:uncharacterized protein (DUF58 family)